MRFKVVKQVAQGFTTSKQQSQDLKPGTPVPDLVLLTIMLFREQ